MSPVAVRGRSPEGARHRVPRVLSAWAVATTLALTPVLLPAASAAEPAGTAHRSARDQPAKPSAPKPRGSQITKWYQDPVGNMAYQARKEAGLLTAYGRNLAIGFVDITGLDDVDTTGYQKNVVDTADLKQSNPALYKSLGLAERPQIQRFVSVPTFNNPSTRDVDGAHSEIRFLTQELAYMGADLSRIFLLYSDLSPCDGCAPRIPANTEVRWMTRQGSGSYQRRERILNAAAAQAHDANMTDADRKRNAEAVARQRQRTIEKRAREAERRANLFGKKPAAGCDTPLAAPAAAGVLTRTQTVGLRTGAADDCGEQDGRNGKSGEKNPSGLSRALAGPVAQAPGGIDFSSLQLQYLSDPGDGSGLQYAFSADPDEADGDVSPATGVRAADQSSDAFFVWLALDPSDFWVNLNPTEPDRIVDDKLGRTDAGRILLQADLQLKKSVGELIHPDTALGKKFWDSIEGGCASFRTWIVPAPAKVHEDGDKLYILDAPMDVKGESEYLRDKGEDAAGSCPKQDEATSDHNEQVYRTMILPRLRKAVNTAPEYAALRRVYLSRVAAEWYRDLSGRKETAYGALVGDGDVSGWTTEEHWKPRDTFDAYVKSYRDGEFDVTRHVTRDGRRYVATYTYGGVDFSRVPFDKVSGASFSSAHAGLPKDVERSLTAPVAADGGDTLWLGSATPKQRALGTSGAGSGGGDGFPGLLGPFGFLGTTRGLPVLVPLLALVAVALASLARRRGWLPGAAGAGRSGGVTLAPRTAVPTSTFGSDPASGSASRSVSRPASASRPASSYASPAARTAPPASAPAPGQAPGPTWKRTSGTAPTSPVPGTAPPGPAPGPAPGPGPAPDPGDPYALHDPVRVAAHLARVAHHLDRPELDRSAADAAMLKAVGDAVAAGRAPDEAGRHFLRHHLTMAELMDGGTPPGEALRAALDTHPFARHYAPEVIDRFPGLFNNNWRRAWGMRPR